MVADEQDHRAVLIAAVRPTPDSPIDAGQGKIRRRPPKLGSRCSTTDDNPSFKRNAYALINEISWTATRKTMKLGDPSPPRQGYRSCA